MADLDLLTVQQVRDLTDRLTAPAQCKVLAAMGIKYRYVRGGRVKVYAADVYGHDEAVTAESEPDFSVFAQRR